MAKIHHNRKKKKKKTPAWNYDKMVMYWCKIVELVI
jgi:hypothetical protein